MHYYPFNSILTFSILCFQPGQLTCNCPCNFPSLYHCNFMLIITIGKLKNGVYMHNSQHG